MRNRASALALASLLLMGAACGGSGPKHNATVLKDLHDPRAAPTATLPAAAPTPIPGGSIPGVPGASGPVPDTYIVKAGDTLGTIAASLPGVSVDDLARANGITDPTRIQVGQQLRVPRPGQGTPGPGASFGGPTFGTTSVTPSAASTVPPTGGAPSGVGSTSGLPTAAAGVVPSATAAAAAGSASEYTVKAGDSACAIAIANGISLQELASANGVTKDQLARLSVGQLLKIPPRTGNKGC